MRQLTLLLLIILSVSLAQAQTQAQMSETAHQDFLKADRSLNETYNKIIKEYKPDTIFVKNLKAAQRLWVQFRDAEMLAMYPERPDEIQGSIAPMCWYAYKQELTDERNKKLKTWLVGVKDDDDCTGSIKQKNNGN